MQFVQNSKNIGSPTAGATAGIAIPANEKRVYFSLQNVGVSPLYVLLGGPTASAGNCHEILAPGATALDGTGGKISSGVVVFDGDIAVGGTAPSFRTIEIAP